MKKRILLAWLFAGLVAARVGAQTVDTVITNALFEPHSVAIDSLNNVYVTDGANNRIVRYAPDTGALTSLAGSATDAPGYVNGIGVLARFFDPKGIVFDSSRNGFYVADSGNHCIRFISVTGGVELYAGIPGTQGSRDGGLTSSAFNSPAGLALAPDGTLYVADTKNNAIRKITKAGVVSTFARGLYEPSGVSVADTGEIWVADTRNHTIKVFSAAGVLDPNRVFGRNSRFTSGSQDALFGTNALFNNPRGIFASTSEAGVLVADSGNHTLRRIYFNKEIGTYSVDTYAGQPGDAGLVNAALRSAKFNSPIGIAYELSNNGFLVVDSAGSALRRITIAPPRPAVSDPVLGWVDFVKDSFGDLVSSLVPVTQSVFNNDVIIAILPEAGTETFFTFGPTPANPLLDEIPFPSRSTGLTPVPYENGLDPSDVGPSIIDPLPDVTIKVISTADGRRPSQLVRSRFQFKTGNPIIVGDNPVQFRLDNQTAQAQMFFTTNGVTDPVPGSPDTFGPIDRGGTVALPIGTNDIQVRVKAFRGNFRDSEVIRKTFSPTNFVPNRISLGFDRGEASSAFIASPGQRFYAPVTLSLIGAQTIYSMQMNLGVQALGASPEIVVNASNEAVGFESMLQAFVPGSNPQRYYTIPPIITTVPRGFTELHDEFTTGSFTNYQGRLIGIGWLLQPRRVSIGPASDQFFDGTVQDLVRYSIAHDTLFDKNNGKVVVGGYSFVVPQSAQPNDSYELRIGRPTATSDGVGAPGSDVFIQAPTNGLLSAVRNVRVGQLQYVVGDVAPFRWFNAGDFGNTNLFNDDVQQVFRAAIYRLNLPPGSFSEPRSDFFDAMDSAGGAITNLLVVDRVFTNFLEYATNVIVSTRIVETNLTFVVTNIVNQPTTFDAFFTNRVLSTNFTVRDISLVPGFPVYETNAVVVTNSFVIHQRYFSSSVPSETVVVTNTVPTRSEVPVTTQVITPVRAFTGWISVTNITPYVPGSPVPTNGFLELTQNPRLNLPNGNDTVIDAMTMGDGELNVDDVFVTFRRSLDPARAWYARYWENGVRRSVRVPNVFRGSAATAAKVLSSTDSPSTAGPVFPGPDSSVAFSADDIQGAAGQVVDVPIRAKVTGTQALRVLMLNLNVRPTEGSPAITSQVEFIPSPLLGAPSMTASTGVENTALAWLQPAPIGILGDGIVGSLRVRLPAGATANSAYRVEFEHASGSGSGLGTFAKTVRDGLIAFRAQETSIYGDSIPDSWRLRHFGTLSNILAQASADADGDGVPNIAEFHAGTSPVDVGSVLKLISQRGGAKGITLRWATMPQRRYVLESTTTLGGNDWQVVTDNVIGNGNEIAITDDSSEAGLRFYRVRLKN